MKEPRFSSFFFHQRLNAIGFSFLGGILLFLLSSFALSALLLLFFGFCFLALAFLWKRGEGRALFLCAALGLALSLCLASFSSLQRGHAQAMSGKEAQAEGYVTWVEEGSFDLSLTRLDGALFLRTVRCESEVLPAQGDRLSGVLLLSDALSREDLQDGVFLRGFFSSEPEKTGRSLLFSTVGSLRSTLSRRFGSSREGVFLRAVLLGDRSLLSQKDREAFSRTGSSHLLAISGLHLTQMIGIFACFFRLLPLSRRKIQLSLIPLIAFLFLLTGGAVSVFRAALMTSLGIFASFLRRRADSVTALTFAACLLTLFNPFVLQSPSFLFSFLSTFAILSAGAPLSEAVYQNFFSVFRKEKGILPSVFSFVLSSFLVSSSVFVFTFPLQLLFFGEVQPLFPLYAILLVPLFSPCIFLGVIHALCCLLPFALPFVEKISFFCARLFLLFVTTLSSGAPGMISLGDLALPLALLCLSLLLFAVLFRCKIRVVLVFHLGILLLLFLIAIF